MIEAPVKGLLSNLEQTTDRYERLLKLAREKQRHIAQNDIDALEQDLNGEDVLIEEIQGLDAERGRLHGETALAALQHSGRKDGDHRAALPGQETLEQLERFLPADVQPKVQRCRHRLRLTVGELNEVNRMNMALIRNSLELAEGMIKALFAVATEGVGYGPTGQSPELDLAPCSIDAKV